MDKVEMLKLILQEDEKLILFWNGQDNWELVNEGCMGIEKEDINKNGIDALLKIVKEEDRQVCEQFFNRIKTVEKQKRTTTFINFKCGNDYELYRIECSKKCSGNAIEKVLVTIVRATAEEGYKFKLSSIITNDKNPSYFVNAAMELIKANPEKKFALIQLDIKDFKVINQQYGEKLGDEILDYILKTLGVFCKESQLYVRLTADVFMIMTDFGIEADLLTFVEKLNKVLVNYKKIPYTIYYGICPIDDIKNGIRFYGDRAAYARQKIKGNALKRVEIFNDEMVEKVKLYKYLEDHMEEALANREFILFLQPKFSISENKLIGAEGLVRWKNKDYGMIMPNDFIPLFEKNGFIMHIDYFVWEEACKVIAKWKKAGEDVVPVSVNMSRKHFGHDDFRKKLDELVEKYGIEKKYLEIEITETIENFQAAEASRLLKNAGYTLLMDDFGSGYSSLNTLKDTQFDVVKIDRVFLNNFIENDRGKKIVEHTIKMTRDIGLDMIAEGVETKEQAMFLSGCGCDKAQGFYYARPMPVEEFDEKYMKNN